MHWYWNSSIITWFDFLNQQGSFHPSQSTAIFPWKKEHMYMFAPLIKSLRESSDVRVKDEFLYTHSEQGKLGILQVTWEG